METGTETGALAAASSPPDTERTITCDEAAHAGGSDSGVELGAGAPGGLDGYASGFESLIGGAASTSCESSLLSFSGDLENTVSGHDTPPRSGSGSSSGAGRRTATPTSSSLRYSPTTGTQQKPVTKSSGNSTSSSRRSQTKTSTGNSLTPTPRTSRRSEARSASRGRTPPVSTDDGRWPSVSIKPARRVTASTTSTSSSAATSGNERRAQRAPITSPPESRSNTLDKYGTLPRRTRVTVTSVSLQSPPATVVETMSSRETSLTRTASLRRQRGVTTSGSSSGYRSDAEDASGSSVRSKSLSRSLPPYPRKRRSHNLRDAASQTCSRDPRSKEELMAKLERLSADYAKVREALELAERNLQMERTQKEALRNESDRIVKRIAAILHGEGGVAPRSADWLAELETRLNATSEVATRHQKELLKVQRNNRNLSEELERTRNAVLMARQQLTDAEEESNELQEFLAAEKSTLAESLREAEEKIASLVRQLEQKEKDILRYQDECRHLVRLSEKRRQEAEALRAQVSSTERLLVSQGGCTTAASVALAGLCSRLECLLPQLNSPSKDEVEIFLNEAYAPSVEASPESKRRATPTQSAPQTPSRSVQDDDEILSQVCSPPGIHDLDEADDVPGRLTGSPSLNDLTQAIISCHTCQKQQTANMSSQNRDGTSTLTDQASELDQLISKLMATFQNLLQQREQSVVELGKFKQKYESEHGALLEANKQLEEQSRRMRQLETAHRIATQQSDEAPTLRERLIERERQLSEVTTKAASSRQLLLSNWRQAADEMRRQYEAIDKALEVLHKEQNLVSQSPALVQLQQELEETNFRCVTLPTPLEAEVSVTQTNSKPLPTSLADSLTLLQSLHIPGTVNGTA